MSMLESNVLIVEPSTMPSEIQSSLQKPIGIRAKSDVTLPTAGDISGEDDTLHLMEGEDESTCYHQHSENISTGLSLENLYQHPTDEDDDEEDDDDDNDDNDEHSEGQAEEKEAAEMAVENEESEPESREDCEEPKKEQVEQESPSAEKKTLDDEVEEAASDASSASSSSEDSVPVSHPPRSILKARLSDPNFVSMTKRSWLKLPVPDLELIHSSAFSAPLHLQAVEEAEPSLRRPATPVRRSKSVTFDKIMVRNYAQTIGDNPACSYGTPIQLDWDYEEMESIDLNMYEGNRAPRRSFRAMILSYYRRRNILMHYYGFTEEEVKEAKRGIKKFKRQRSFTRQVLPLMVVEEASESLLRKLQRRKSKTSEESQEAV